MKGITVEKLGAPGVLSSDIEIPEPSDTQILVKSIYTAVNPVDAFMADYGLLVVEWPLVPGCDASGTVIKAGKDAVSPLGVPFKEGDEVFGCTRLGSKGYSPWQEYFLMDSGVTFPKPKSLTAAEASTVGVGVLTAFLGVFDGLKIPLVDLEAPKAQDDWVLVFGGASSVGKYAVQTLKILGYKVVTTCSAKSFDLLKSLGADATIDYKSSDEEIISSLKEITSGSLIFIFDAVSVNNALATSIFASLPSQSSSSSTIQRRYTTTNDWDPLPSEPSFVTTPILLGPIGRTDAGDLNKKFGEYIPAILKLFDEGKLKVGEFDVLAEGIEGILEAWEVLKSGKAGSRKVVVKVVEN
ncbi:chaperonin 10-like protein [Dendryphion nanum]|uniref:Chaperonin 10-like protein n=1 Tax=Dendryphion nanum TaxID=256645 RepID=A0A9P9EDA5_9PLEO|nr:chaperonin 10-like protein [Dendryphion nanum]